MPRLFVVLALVAASCAALADPAYKGMSLTSWSQNALASAGCDQSITNMRGIGVDTVAINVWEFQDNENSTVITPDYSLYSSSEASLRHAIQKAHGLGMNVILKPNVDLRNGNWRSFINPSAAWFSAYDTFIRKYATIAQEEGVHMMSIGTEFGNAQTWTSNWRGIASSARSVYGGQLTYSANHGSEQDVAWWDAMDQIGIDAYYPLSTNSNPTLATLKSAWNSRANSIGSWLSSTGLDKKILFTEVGYRSVVGAAAAPWDWSSGGAVDLQLQANCYEALLSELSGRNWFNGAMWWNWETNPSAGGLTDNGFTPQGKPASQVLRNYYQPVPEPATWAILIAGLAGLRRVKRK